MTGLIIPDHPVVADRLARLRDKTTSAADFRVAMKSLAPFLVYEAARGLATRDIEFETPIARARGKTLKSRVVLFPILRAGLGLLDGALDVFPEARVGLIGAYRDEMTFEPVEYHRSGPSDLTDCSVFVLDPMLATGGSAAFAIARVKEMGALAIRLVSVLAAPDGIDTMRLAHPDVPIVVAAVDPELDGNKYIVPGLGDAGDRFFGT